MCQDPTISAQKEEDGTAKMFIIVCSILIIFVITLLAIQAWKWHQARALAQLSIEVSKQAH
tara:strand:- start:327 stop:509 length:183 start_codon:yes stop_codon:yes gene_type:complete